jgi:hypothetical protein
MNNAAEYIIDNSTFLTTVVLRSMHIAARRFNGFEANQSSSIHAPSRFLNGTLYGNAIFDEKSRNEVEEKNKFCISIPDACKRKRVKGKTVSVPQRYDQGMHLHHFPTEKTTLVLSIQPFTDYDTQADGFLNLLWAELQRNGWDSSDKAYFFEQLDPKALVQRYLNACWDTMVDYALYHRDFSLPSYHAHEGALAA